LADEATGNDRTADEQRRDEAVGRLNEGQLKRFQHQIFLLVERNDAEPSARLQHHLATIIAKELPATDEWRDLQQATRDDEAKRGPLAEHGGTAPTEQRDEDRSNPAHSASNQKPVAPSKPDPMEGVPPSGTRDYSKLQEAHDEVRDTTNHDELSAERVLARSNEESIHRQQAEVAVSTRGEVPRDSAMTREQMRDEIKAMVRASRENESSRGEDGPQHDDNNNAPPSPGRGIGR
jgi:hypothetical protein